MFICRNYLLRANTLKRFPNTYVHRPFLCSSQRTITNTRLASQSSQDSPTNRREDARVGGRFPEEVESASRGESVATPTQIFLDQATREAEEAKFGITSEKKRFAPVWTYFKLRRAAKHLIIHQPTVFFHKVISVGRKDKVLDVFHCLAKDLPTIYQGVTYQDRLEVLSRLLTAVSAEKLVSKDRLLFLIQSLHDSNELRFMARRAIGFAARFVVVSESDETLDPQLIALLTPHLLDYALHPDADEKSHVLQVDAAHQISPLYAFVHRLTTLGLVDQALALFQTLVQDKLITDTDMQGVDLGSDDFKAIVLSTIVRSCIRRGWLARAMDFLSGALNSDETLHQSFMEPLQSLAQMLLDRQKGHDLDSIAGMLTKIIQFRGALTAPKNLFLSFYDAARTNNRGDLMAMVYHKTSSVTPSSRYPAPSGPNILFLLQHCTFKSRNLRVAYLLTEHIVKKDPPIPSHDIGGVIAAVATAGFATFSRILWDRYRDGRNLDLIEGNASTMLRLVSLFGSVVRHWEQCDPRKSDSSRGGSPLHHEPLGDRSPQEVSSQPVNGLSVDLASLPESRLDEQTTNNADDIPSLQFEGKDTADAAEWKTRAEDARAFALDVIDAFKAKKFPLKAAPHHDLNALARAYFILGEISKGFATLKFILERKEVPDLRDVNVALSAMAEFDPNGAFRMIQRMVKLGLQPDAVSFGTVIHRAILHEDMALVAKLMEKAREVHLEDLTFKTLGTLIRSSISSQPESQDSSDAREELDKAQELVGTILDANLVPTPRMGIDCIVAALRADDPVMAFKFWKLIVKDKVEWDGVHATRTRQRIAQRIRRHCIHGSLDRDLGRTMLSALGEGVSVATDRRRKSTPSVATPTQP